MFDGKLEIKAKENFMRGRKTTDGNILGWYQEDEKQQNDQICGNFLQFLVSGLVLSIESLNLFPIALGMS